MTVLAADIAGALWFQLLQMFVAFNTLVYACFAIARLWPRRGR